MNVPIENGAITDDHRIRASLQTLNFVREAGAKVIVCSHLGQPKGKRDPKYSLKPVAEHLEKLTGHKAVLAPDTIGPEVEKMASELKAGEMLVLENPRFYAEEEKNDPEFSKKLANLAEVYINDAFAVDHRAHATTVGITQYIAEKAAGFTLKTEIEFFNRALLNPERPLAAIFGGAKVSTKMRAIKNVAERADKVLVGGAMANTFFVAMGHSVGKSLFEPEQVEAAKEALEWFAKGKSKLILPVDVVVAKSLDSGVETKVVPVESIPADLMALDVGPETLKLFAAQLADAKTIVWNGPVGAFETEEFSAGTYGIIDILAGLSALTVVGGGDTDLALHRKHAMEKMGYVSTGGGAFLELLEGRKLPGVEALG